MGTLSGVGTAECRPTAVVITMVLGVVLGVAAMAALTVLYHLMYAWENPEAAAPALGVALLFGTVGSMVGSVAAVAGASVALAIFDRGLRRSRLVQARIAGLGAVVSGLLLLAYLGPAVLNGGDILGISAVTSFALMYFRARAHTSVNSAPDGRGVPVAP